MLVGLRQTAIMSDDFDDEIAQTIPANIYMFAGASDRYVLIPVRFLKTKQSALISRRVFGTVSKVLKFPTSKHSNFLILLAKLVGLVHRHCYKLYTATKVMTIFATLGRRRCSLCGRKSRKSD